MLLGTDDLDLLESKVENFLDENLTTVLTQLNRNGKLEDFLRLINAESLLESSNDFSFNPYGYIVVLGATEVSNETLLSVGKKLGIEKNRFILHTDFDKTKRVDISSMQYNSNYATIICGPMPHSTISKGEYGSTIARLETEDGFPPVKRLGCNSLKISKSNFKEALYDLINSGKIKTN